MTDRRYIPTLAEAAETRALNSRLLWRMAVVMLGWVALVLLVTAMLEWWL
ncbi:hypothetical protein [Methylobacterium sp. Leaf108]|nr:hypothetical protein [Methylobacterium sp. Leaf108]